jgi:excisionase family DNA binding protein
MESIEQEMSVSTTALQTDYIDPDELPPIATVAEIARFLRVRPNLVYAMYRRGEIPGGRRVGRSIRFSKKIVLEWLLSGDSGGNKKHRH